MHLDGRTFPRWLHRPRAILPQLREKLSVWWVADWPLRGRPGVAPTQRVKTKSAIYQSHAAGRWDAPNGHPIAPHP